VTIEAGGVDINSGYAKQSALGMAYKHDFTDMFAVDASLATLRTNTLAGQEGVDTTTVRSEIGGDVKYAVLPGIGIYNRLALGNQSGSWRGVNSSFGYWAEEAGVTGQYKQFDAKLGYRWRNAFDDGYGFRTQTTRTGLGYSVTQADRIGVSYDFIEGDYKARQWGVNYTRSF